MPSTLAKQSKTHNPLDIQTFELAPTKMHKVVLGRFSVGDAEPRFRIIYHEQDPENPNVVTYHDEPILDREDETYIVVRQFQSFSQCIHRLTVRFATKADKALDID
jgi:hypothetical protein